MSEATMEMRVPLSTAPTYTRQVAGRILRRWGARIGLAWIILLVLLAVFAPFLASSHPLLMKSQGHWSSPVLQNLGPADVILQFAFWSFLILWPFRLRSSTKVIVWIAGLLLVGAAAIAWVHPPQLVVYETYRDMQSEGQIEEAIFAPIPFS